MEGAEEFEMAVAGVEAAGFSPEAPEAPETPGAAPRESVKAGRLTYSSKGKARSNPSRRMSTWPTSPKRWPEDKAEATAATVPGAHFPPMSRAIT